MWRAFVITLGLAGAAAVDSAWAQQNREPGGASPPATSRRLSPAEMRADLLDRLFARLRTTSLNNEALVIEQQIWKIWLTSDSATAQALMNQAVAAMSARELDAALKILNSLVKGHPDFMEAWNKRATLYFMQGRLDASLDDIARVLDLEPRHFGALAGLGMIKERQGDTEAALVAFRAALSVNPHMPGVIQAVKEIERRSAPI
jgi:tetratricopeptide (TPR) repeat protein